VLVVGALSDDARKAVELMLPQAKQLFNEAHRYSFEQGRLEGEARGETKGKALGQAKAVLLILSTRGLPISAVQERHIAECTDLDLLDQWIQRAVTVPSVEALLA
jgi:hypothetical protein